MCAGVSLAVRPLWRIAGGRAGSVLLSFRERRVVNKQKSEGLVSVALDIGTTTLNVRFRLVAALTRGARRARMAASELTAPFSMANLCSRTT